MNSLTKIATVFGSLEAEILKGMLEANEIPVLLKGEAAGKAIGLGVGPLAEVDILVPEHLEQQALQLVKQYRSSSATE